MYIGKVVRAMPMSSCGFGNGELKMFKCNCPHEVRAGCSEPQCPHFDFRTLMMAEAWEKYPQENGTHRRAFIEGAKWARQYQKIAKED